MRIMKRFMLLLPITLLAAGCEVQGTGLPPVGLPAEPVAAVETDTCGSQRYDYLAGQPKAVIDQTVLPEGTRVILPGQAVTMDFQAERLNVLIDGNAAVERVYCG